MSAGYIIIIITTIVIGTHHRSGTEMIVKKDLDDALKKAGKFEASDLDVFTQLFILFDFQGDGDR